MCTLTFTCRERKEVGTHTERARRYRYVGTPRYTYIEKGGIGM